MVLVPLDPVVPLVPPEPEVPSVPAVVVVVVVVVVESASVLLVVIDSAPLLTLLMRGGDGLSNLTDLVDLVMGGDGGLPIFFFVLGIAPSPSPSSLFGIIGGNSGQLSLSSLDSSSISLLLSSLRSSILLRNTSNFSCVFLFSFSNSSILLDWLIIILSIADSSCSIRVLRRAVFRFGVMFPLSIPLPFVAILPRWELRGRRGGGNDSAEVEQAAIGWPFCRIVPRSVLNVMVSGSLLRLRLGFLTLLILPGCWPLPLHQSNDIKSNNVRVAANVFITASMYKIFAVSYGSTITTLLSFSTFSKIF